eukprot:CAMPEP_0181315978 /NCGR_PEP_ID=MMETSP1101-20121128/15654_1 /TAXON_ID=46948 /ORGANISM="Rhodomonas abbreviata, Strain Caron Lab Isolate" /LENGTH=78 /DNA_ID=CAMNT_0023423203 /DNA_START=15 /DNA_END=251 /DNA_ORIENTATION=-
MFALLDHASNHKGCSLTLPCSDPSSAITPGRFIQMANVHVGNDNDYSFSGSSEEQALLAKTKVHGNKLPRNLLQATRS